MTYLLPIIDLKSDHKHLIRALVSIATFREFNQEDDFILYDATQRPPKTAAFVDEMSRQMNFIIRKLSYPRDHFRSRAYPKLMFNRYVALLDFLDSTPSELNLILLDDDIIWKEKLEFLDSAKEYDLLPWAWYENGKVMLCDCITLIRTNQETRRFIRFLNDMFSDMLADPELLGYLRPLTSRNNQEPDSEAMLEIACGLYPVSIGFLVKHTKNFRISHAHYARYQKDRKDMVEQVPRIPTINSIMKFFRLRDLGILL